MRAASRFALARCPQRAELHADAPWPWVPRRAARAGGLGKEAFLEPGDNFAVFPILQKQSSLPCLGWTVDKGPVRPDPVGCCRKLSRLVLGSLAAAGVASCETQVLEWQSSHGFAGVGEAS